MGRSRRLSTRIYSPAPKRRAQHEPRTSHGPLYRLMAWADTSVVPVSPPKGPLHAPDGLSAGLAQSHAWRAVRRPSTPALLHNQARRHPRHNAIPHYMRRRPQDGESTEPSARPAARGMRAAWRKQPTRALSARLRCPPASSAPRNVLAADPKAMEITQANTAPYRSSQPDAGRAWRWGTRLTASKLSPRSAPGRYHVRIASTESRYSASGDGSFDALGTPAPSSGLGSERAGPWLRTLHGAWAVSLHAQFRTRTYFKLQRARRIGWVRILRVPPGCFGPSATRSHLLRLGLHRFLRPNVTSS